MITMDITNRIGNIGCEPSRNRYHAVTLNGISLPSVPDYIEGESLWSYVTRLARSNGFDDVQYFLQYKLFGGRTSKEKGWNKYGYDIPTPHIYRMLDIEGVDDIILRTTTFGIMRLFTSESYQMERVISYATEWQKGVSGFLRPAAITEGIKVCPECEREDDVPHYHLIHQAPGMKICPIHGCVLEAIRDNGSRSPFIIGKDDEKDQEAISSYLYAIYSTNTGGTILHLRNNIFSRLSELSGGGHPWETVNRLKDDSHFNDIITRGVALKRFIEFDQVFDKILPSQIIPLISRIFSSPEEFISSLSSMHNPLYEESSLRMLLRNDRNHFELLGLFDESMLRLKCTGCGSVFPTTPFALLLGVGCPVCNQDTFSVEKFNLQYLLYNTRMMDLFVAELSSNIRIPQLKDGMKQKEKKPETTAKPEPTEKPKPERRQSPETPAESGPSCISNINRYIDRNRIISIKKMESFGEQDFANRYIRTLVKEGRLDRLAPGLYCRVDRNPDETSGMPYEKPALNLLYEKYCTRNGFRIGGPICDPLLLVAGCRINEPRYAFVAYTGKESDGRPYIRRKVHDIPIDIYYSPVPVTDDNWEVISLIMTMMHWKRITHPYSAARKALGRWAVRCGITEEKVLEYSRFFNAAAIERTVYFTRKNL